MIQFLQWLQHRNEEYQQKHYEPQILQLCLSPFTLCLNQLRQQYLNHKTFHFSNIMAGDKNKKKNYVPNNNDHLRYWLCALYNLKV